MSSHDITVESDAPMLSTLRNAAAIARLSPNIKVGASSPPKHRLDHQREGKRWVRRRDNSRFATNPHIVKPTTKDFGVYTSSPRTTFPKPLPPFLPRHLSAPSALTPSRDPSSANAGRYSLSLKGVRRELRKSGPRSEQIVLDIEQELTQWLHSGGILLCPDSNPTLLSPGLGKPLGKSNSIHELRRSPTELVWRIDENFPRYLLHCVARFHGIVSFSKPVHEGDIRVTHLLRPNVARPDFMAPDALDTPPVSDSDIFSVVMDTEDSDATSEQEHSLASDGGEVQCSRAGGFLEERDSAVPSRSLHEHISQNETDSSVCEEHEDLSMSVDSLTPAVDNYDWEQTPRRRGARTDSSRSPARPVRRTFRHVSRPLMLEGNQLEFWRYVFA